MILTIICRRCSDPLIRAQNDVSVFDLPVFSRKLVVDSTAENVNCSALEALNTKEGSTPGILECHGLTFSTGDMVRPPVPSIFKVLLVYLFI